MNTITLQLQLLLQWVSVVWDMLVLVLVLVIVVLVLVQVPSLSSANSSLHLVLLLCVEDVGYTLVSTTFAEPTGYGPCTVLA